MDALVAYSDSDSDGSSEAASDKEPSSFVKGSTASGSAQQEHQTDQYSDDASSRRPVDANFPAKPPAAKSRLPPPPLPKPAGDDSKNSTEDPSQHLGRIRSFPHVEGNFAGYVFLKAGHAVGLETAAAEILNGARDALPSDLVVHAISLDEMHLSMSRTFAVRRHQIEPLVALIAQRLRGQRAFSATLAGARLYANDDGTRAFAGIRVAAGHDRLRQLVAAVDKALREFRLPSYYSESDFHVSVGWAVGALPAPPPPCRWEGPAVALPVARLHAKIGARSYTFNFDP